MLDRLLTALDRVAPAPAVSAHCDGPCGVYDPASARIAAESVVAMTKKILDLDMSTGIEAHNTFSRFVAIKEEQAELTKHELSILWHDYFKPNHLEAAPDLHDIVWNAIKAASACKTSVSLENCEALMAAVENVHNIFWASKGKDVPFVTVS